MRKATKEEIREIKILLDLNRSALGFIPTAIIEKAVLEGRVLLFAGKSGVIAGFVHFRCCHDGHATIYQIAVAPEYQQNGIGKTLVDAVINEARRHGCKLLRLKCPVDLSANGFYSKLGFVRIAVESGKHRPLAVWELDLNKQSNYFQCKTPKFFAGLTGNPSEVRKIIEIWTKTGEKRDPFSNVIITPAFAKPGMIDFVLNLKEEKGATVIFDSGGYQVQTGRTTYEELFDRLIRLYKKHSWADWYVLPDHVPRSDDSDEEVEFKVRETLDFGRLFLRMMPRDFSKKVIGVVHGRTEEQIHHCIKTYANLGVKYIGFGSFGTSGPNGTVNLVSRRSLELLSELQKLAIEHNMCLHIFGVGSPSQLIRIHKVGIMFDSFDSSSWWKAGGFGKIFFPTGSQLHVTRMKDYKSTTQEIEREKVRTHHECPFCADVSQLRKSRIARIMHNLVCVLDTLEVIGDS